MIFLSGGRLGRPASEVPSPTHLFGHSLVRNVADRQVARHRTASRFSVTGAVTRLATARRSPPRRQPKNALHYRTPSLCFRCSTAARIWSVSHAVQSGARRRAHARFHRPRPAVAPHTISGMYFSRARCQSEARKAVSGMARINPRTPPSVPSRDNLRPRTWVTARNHRRITAPHTRLRLGPCPRRRSRRLSP